MKNVAVVLSGCGFKDGAEITEAVSALIALSEFGANYQVFAPNLDITSTNHLKDSSGETRNVMVESARIARGNVQDIKTLKPDQFDALVFPGGFGAALHLCNWAQNGSGCTVNPEVEQTIKTFHSQSKPIGAICIAPALIARVLGGKGVTVTIGTDKETAQEIGKTGAQHVECAVDDYVTDREHKVITTPAYMYDAKPHQVFTGVRKAIKELVEMA
ncbi:MAG: isoprenoid biosynthesis glyoxalase ElbB [Bdellovibrionales bacterium]|nr:isoprenoid biosynthesis glyoxalase ElbB [Bdellovibrionales bacterium]